MSLQRQLLALVWIIGLMCFGLMLFVNLSTMQGKLNEQQQQTVAQVEQMTRLSLEAQSQRQLTQTLPRLLEQALKNPTLHSITVTLFSPQSTLIERNAQARSRAPHWFTKAFPVEQNTLEETVFFSDGGQANLRLVSSEFYVQDQLWILFKRLVLIYLLAVVMIGAVASMVVGKLIRPLAAIEKQAKAIERKDFTVRSPVPKTRELGRAVSALNHMSDIIYKRFKDNARQLQSLKTQIQQDPETGVFSRRFTLQQIEGRIAEGRQQYALIVLRLTHASQVRRSYGFPIWSEMVKASISILESSFKAFQPTLGRISEHEFAVLIPAVLPADIHQQIRACNQQMKQLHGKGIAPTPEVCTIAGCVIQPQDNASTLLTRIDNMLRQTESEGMNGYIWRANVEPSGMMRTGQEWVALLKDRIRRKALVIERQTLVNSVGGNPIHYEVYARLNDEVDQQMSAGNFLPVIEQFNLGAELDLAVLETALAQDFDAPVSINVSLASIHDTMFVSRLAGLSSEQRKKVVIEIPETHYQREPKAVQAFVKILRSLGIEFGMDNLGNAKIKLDYIAKLRPNYVKLSPALCQAKDQESLHMVTIICNTVHNLEIPVYATVVESQQQLLQLHETGIDGFLGYINNPGNQMKTPSQPQAQPLAD
ncbi:EAL domain-containing protein [Paraferrimonas sedimenticola]|uniref:GGDEF domain-containing protein n=1 Tax=Paraferrimonas sedimenticola TaxID=375674 RepID=A0AA37W1G8_9GAMM|nr:EAL domain-containing protein [Paraferrimonas sedimenticola]GLP96207.1 GGDEF domain-containing protein [Paraferrimonas sedimenticola]